jgi:hypothetical protein
LVDLSFREQPSSSAKRAFTSPSEDVNLSAESRQVRPREEWSEHRMTTIKKPVMSIYVDRRHPEHWIVRDREGRFWVVPPEEGAWAKREPLHPSEDADLEPVPGHYLYMLGMPV